MSAQAHILVSSGTQDIDDRIAHFTAKLAYETDAWDLRDIEEDVVIVDARSDSAFAAEHIPGAISFPHRTINAQTTAALRRDCLYVTYCDGIGCNASTKSALNLARLGFRVKELIGGLDWWKRDGYAHRHEHPRIGLKPLRSDRQAFPEEQPAWPARQNPVSSSF